MSIPTAQTAPGPATRRPPSPLSADAAATEAVVRAHLRAFVEGRGVAALLADYREDALLCCDGEAFRGRAEIGAFFAAFLAGLPAGAVGRFELSALQVHGRLAYITWRSGDDIPLGTDTFLVEGGRIAAQTVAVYRAARSPAG